MKGPFLTGVELTNARSFASGVSIELSEGVTVICAPNGVGKTTLFESFELALTGGIKRLETGLSPFVRSGTRDAQVTISWSTTSGPRSRTVRVGSGSLVTATGPLESLLGPTDAAALPYLLPLTHLFCQNDERWVVRADPKVAGISLDRLPIGRDGSTARTALGGAKNAATRASDRAVAERTDAERALEVWTNAVDRRDTARRQLPTDLVPLTDLHARMRAMVDRPWAGPVPPTVTAENLDTTTSTWAIRLADYQTELDRRGARLSSLPPVLAGMASLDAALAMAENSVTAATLAVEDLRRAVGIAASTEDQVTRAETDARDLVERVRHHERLAIARRDLSASVERVQAAIVTAESTLRAHVALLEEATSRARAVEADAAWHETRRARRAALTTEENRLAASRLALTNWRAYELALTRISAERATVIATLIEARTRADQAEVVAGQLAGLALEARRRLESLTAATDAVSTAVASIAQHLPDSEGTCPVCLTPHGIDTLRSKMEEAQKRLSPALQAATKEVADADEAALSASRLRQDRVSEVEVLEERKRTLEQGMETYQDQIRLQRAVELLAGADLETADGVLADADRKIQEEQILLAEPGPVEPTSSERASVQTAEIQARTAHEIAAGDRDRLLGELERTQAALAAAAIPEAVPTDSGTAERALEDATSRRIAATAETTRSRERLSDAESELQRAGVRRVEALTARERQVALWSNEGLPGPPDSAVLAETVREHGVAVSGAAADAEQIARTRQEISRWRTAAQLHAAQAEVDRIRGTATEVDHETSLTRKRAEAAAEATRRLRVRKLMDDLDDGLKERLDSIRDQIVTPLNPFRQALLRRIVRDDRFAGTRLDFTTGKGGSPQASTNVELHGRRESADLVASEGQLADVELTFLLAMAVKHAWAPWRGLLLDDPTQHHDVVHAAGVFDVLRDYVADYGFQVVLATHDMLQAEFLVRKLRNDGISHAVWRLVHGPDGVTAELRDDK